MTPTDQPADPVVELPVVAGRQLRLLVGGRSTSGVPLLYLHGAGDLGGWLPALGRLAESRTVLRPDHPGFNGSEDDPAITSVAGLAARHLALLDQLGVERVDLVGTSLGGWVAAELALAAPERVRRLVLVDAAGLRPDGPAPDMFTLDPDALVELVSGDGEALTEGRARDAAVRADPALSDRRARNTEATRRLAARPYMHDPSLAPRLAQLDVRTLVVWGTADGLLPVQLGTRWARLVPDARLVLLDGAGHVPLLDRPVQFADLLTRFLDGPGWPVEARPVDAEPARA